jgi:predicted MPP superfamily phosphohydrolase
MDYRGVMKRRYYLLMGVAALVCYSGLIEPNWISQKTYNLTIDGLRSREISIVQIGDVHTSRFGRRERETIRRIEEIDPDFILISGDLYKSQSELSAGLTFLSKLRARHGIYLVPGNADGVLLNCIGWRRVRPDTLNCRILRNENVDCGAFTLVGIDDPVSYRHNVLEAYKGVSPTKPVIVMTHFHPDSLLWEIERMGADLILSGHTHGGHIGVGALVGLVPYAYRSRYIAGLYTLNRGYLNVTRGVGTGIFPFRFLCRPEIVVFHLKGN